jgi:hypothetical protein
VGEIDRRPSDDFDPQAPVAPMYRYLQSLRQPLTLQAVIV